MSEEKLQMAVARYLDHHPVTKGFWFHPPNGGKRNVVTAAKLKAQGVKAGVPDVMIVKPWRWPSREGAGLAIELKTATGLVRPSQRQWHETLRSCGWRVGVCRSLDEVVELVQECYG